MKIIWNSELYHYGMPRRSGRYKWGSGKDPYHHGASTPRRLIRKYDKLQDKLDKNHNKQDAINKKLSGPLNSRSINKMNKYNEKASKYEKRKNKAERKLEKGKDISRRQQKAIDKYNEFSSKADMAGSRTAKKRSKLGSLESEEQRIIAKMNKIDKKLEKKYMKDVDPDDLKRGKEYLDSLDIMTKKIMDDYKGYDRFPYNGEVSPNTYKGAREKAKTLMDSRVKENIKAIEKLGYKYSTDEKFGTNTFKKTVKIKDGTNVDISAVNNKFDKKYMQEVDNVVAKKATTWVVMGKRKTVELNSMTIRDPKNVTSPYIVCRADDSGRKLKTVDVSFVNEEDNHYPSASYDMKKKRWTGSYDG